MAKTKDMPREMFDNALREAIEDQARNKRTRAPNALPWTDEIDREILRANVELGLGARAIAAAMRSAHGWGSRGTVTERLAKLKATGK